ncbi:MAG: (deoxy)nucleoside triphosphate pyrophosphohydrolase [Geopsychrobacter sp.]|nr:(deoxy)nucleoside triphosphate pyrophosphohydrolase [Geopsychrobacter sp.]
MTTPPTIRNFPLLVTAAVIIQKGQVLITRRPAHKPQGGLWEFPGGKLDPGESPTEALRREILEELALEIKVEDIVDALYHQYDWGSVLVLAYHCQIQRGVPQNIEVTEHRWVPLEKLHMFNFLPADKPLVAKIQAGN